MKNAIIIDIDNCWMDSRLWLSKEPKGSKNEDDWVEMYRKVYLCTPNNAFISDVQNLVSEYRLFPIFLTSRSHKIKNSTIFQIHNNSKFVVDENCLLFMRGENDYRSSFKVKRDLLEEIMKEYNVLYAIDDDMRNVNMYKEMSVKTVIHYNIELHDYNTL